MSPTVWIVSYDVCAPSRLRKVYRILCGYGEWLQLSMFRCELSERELVVLKAELRAELDLEVDQVLFIDTGPADGRGGNCIEGLGKPLPERKRMLIF